MSLVVLSKNWKRKGARLPKNVAIAKAKKAQKRVRVAKPRRGK